MRINLVKGLQVGKSGRTLKFKKASERYQEMYERLCRISVCINRGFIHRIVDTALNYWRNLIFW